MTLLVSATERASIVKLVVAMFNAAPGATYLAELATSFEANGRSLSKLAGDLASTTTYKTLNPVFQTAGEFATAFLKPLGLQNNAEAVDFVTAKLNAGVNKGQIAYEASQALSAYTGTDAELLAAKSTLSNKTAVAEYYSVSKAVAETDLTVLKAALAGVTSDAATVADVKTAMDDTAPATIGFSTGQDALNGTAGSDVISGYIFDNQNSFQSGDTVDGKAGTDELQVELGNSSQFAIRATTANVEKVFFTSQSTNWGSNGNNNVDTTGQKNTVDAEKMVGVKEWWSTDSRADLKIEDVRILDNEITSDITIGLRNTDPGSMGAANKVDFEVYFSPESLRPASAVQSTSLTLVVSNPLRVVDGFKAAKPLDNVPYTKFAFNLDGKQLIVELDLKNVDTYDQLYAALTKAVAAKPELAGVVVERIVGGYPYFSTDGEARVADKFTLKLADHTLTPTSGPGWMAESGLPSDNAFLATVQPGDMSATAPLITSKIILDNVGREDEAGTLTIGSMSTHGGVERFEIVVENNADNAYTGTQSGSWLGNMSSTNNTLREVTVVNAADGIANPDYLYLGTNSDQAGNNLGVQQDWPGGLDRVYDAITPVTTSLVNPDGLTDVRLFDAAAMKGDVFVGASITGESIRKYQDLVDTLSKDKADNVAFQYLTGSGDDSIHLHLDASAVNSNSNVVPGRHDFSFLADGGAGNDNIEVAIVNPASGVSGSNEDWYVNQGINAYVVVNGRAGNDTINTLGAGDASINGGSGDDAIYADNSGLNAVSGARAVWGFNTALVNGVRDSNIEDIRSDAPASVSAVNAKLTVSFMGFSKTVTIADSVGKLSNVTITDLSINQAIKDAINSDSVLSKLLVAQDGPGRTLGVASLIDGKMTADDLSISFSNTALTAAQSKATLFPVTATSALLDGYTTTTLATLSNVPGSYDGADSTAVSNNTITGDTGNDVIVLGTTLGTNALTSSNDTVVFTGSGNGTDTIVNFVSGNGFDSDVLDFSAYGVSGVYVGGTLVGGAAPSAQLDQYIKLVESTNDGAYSMYVMDSGADNAFGGTTANADVIVSKIGVVDFGAQQDFVVANFAI